MLSAQVEYWKLAETSRHNLETEAQGREQLRQGWTSIKETGRHNLETESQGRFNMYENQRHNVQQEQLGWSNLAETQRHNQQTETLGWANLQESQRHNVATETENVRTHQVNEAIGWSNAASSRISANAAQQRAQASYMEALLENDYVNIAYQQLGIEQQRADTAQFQAESQANRYDTQNQIDWVNHATSDWGTGSNVERNEAQTDIQWTQTVINALLGASREARGWVNIFGD